MLKIVLLFPDLLGTYGDGGNATVLETRARARAIPVRTESVEIGDVIPAADLYLLGGGEDGPQRLACELLREGGLEQRVADGAGVFAVCAGLQILGHAFSVEGDASHPGLGIADVTTTRGAKRAVGDMATRVGSATMVGFENHGGVTTLGSDVAPLGHVLRGRGNDGRVDGYRSERLWATYAHGPVLALNPWLADEVLSDITGETLAPWPSVADRLYEERCSHVNTRHPVADRRADRH